MHISQYRQYSQCSQCREKVLSTKDKEERVAKQYKVQCTRYKGKWITYNGKRRKKGGGNSTRYNVQGTKGEINGGDSTLSFPT